MTTKICTTKRASSARKAVATGQAGATTRAIGAYMTMWCSTMSCAARTLRPSMSTERCGIAAL